MKIDMHCHSYYSNDSIASPEALLKMALKKGLNGIALTDHNTTEGWSKAEQVAKNLGAILIKGEEIKIKENRKTIGEILAYFLTQEIDPRNKTIEDVIEEIKSQNGVAIIAHPYHWRKPFKYLEKFKKMANGIEAFNSRSQSKNGNQKSLEFGQKNNLIMIAGSDCHSSFEVGSAYTEIEAVSIEEFKQGLLNGKVQISGQQAGIQVQVFATLGKILHFFWKPV